MTVTSNLDTLRSVRTADDVAAIFGMSYAALAGAIYRMPESRRYRTFVLKKKSGGDRVINAPNRQLREIQKKLANILAGHYEPRPPVHGFVAGRSVVSNASRHVAKRFVLNVDIEDFFGTLHFGRVRNLFCAKPFEVPRAAATVLAQICCFRNRLPQGAPTSPVVTNIVCRKLDRQLQLLAKHHRATYTRYADDITFSFSTTRGKLPTAIVVATVDGTDVGDGLKAVIEANGFRLNSAKTRLRGPGQRLEVTGLTVNEFVNVRRQFVRRTGSMIYAWEKFGLDAASAEFTSKYLHNARQRAATPPKFYQVVKGRLAYLHMVRGRTDPIYVKLAKRFNALTADVSQHLPLREASAGEKREFAAVYVIEILYDDELGNHCEQGTGFFLDGVGFVTAAHVVSRAGRPYADIKAYLYSDQCNTFRVDVKVIDDHRDIALCDLVREGQSHMPEAVLSCSGATPQPGDRVTLVGFPAYKIGQTPYVTEGTVASMYVQHGVRKIEISQQIRGGNSGGPVLNDAHQVIGVAVEGADKATGNNAVVLIAEVMAVGARQQR